MMMRNSGYVRQVDTLGRLVLPIDLRKSLEIKAGEDSVEIFLDAENKRVILQKYDPPIPKCIFCGTIDNVTHFKEQNICSRCISELVETSRAE